MFEIIENLIDSYCAKTESLLDISALTIEHGLHSFRYGSSAFLSYMFSALSLQDGSLFYDLGSGYGKVLLYGAINFPNVQFKGIEIVPERYRVCNMLAEKFGLKNIQVTCADILSSNLSDGDVFYIFNSLYNFQYDALFETLRAISKNKPIKVIAESRCDVFDRQEWLKVYDIVDIDILRKIKFYYSVSPECSCRR